MAQESVTLIGNSYIESVKPMAQQISLEPQESLFFAHAILDQPSYRVLTIYNQGDVSCFFKIKSLSGAFAVYPAVGIITRQSRCSVVVQFNPQREGVDHSKLVLKFNRTLKSVAGFFRNQ